jgi:hypothetical protein
VILVAWLLVVSLAVVLADGWLTRHHARADGDTEQVIAALHRNRRRLQVAQFKVELRRDAAKARRRLGDELDALDKRECDS